MENKFEAVECIKTLRCDFISDTESMSFEIYFKHLFLNQFHISIEVLFYMMRKHMRLDSYEKQI